VPLKFQCLRPGRRGPFAPTPQILGTALASVLLTPLRFSFPIYVHVETNSTTYLGGTAMLPQPSEDQPSPLPTQSGAGEQIWNARFDERIGAGFEAGRGVGTAGVWARRMGRVSAAGDGRRHKVQRAGFGPSGRSSIGIHRS
jgi:hypothetical protein